MKILDTQKFIDDLNVAIENSTKTENGDSKIVITTEPVLTKDENGSIYFKICLKKGLIQKKIAIYIFERKNGITTFIVNGDTMDLLFENATIKSPEIALTYLKTILEGDIKWINNTKKSAFPKKKPQRPGGKFSKNKKYPPKKNYGSSYNGKKNYSSGKSYGNGERSNKPRYDRNGRSNIQMNDGARRQSKPYVHRNQNGNSTYRKNYK